MQAWDTANMHDETPISIPSRRRLIGGAALLAPAAGLLAACQSIAEERRHKETPSDDIAVLNSALGLEHGLIAAYAAAAASGRVAGDKATVLQPFAADHRRHAEALRGLVEHLGGMPVEAPTDTASPIAALAGEAEILNFLLGLERGVALTYLAAVPALLDRSLARDAASILGVETMHWTLLRQAIGEPAVPAAFLA
jgi:hypothetical protein